MEQKRNTIDGATLLSRPFVPLPFIVDTLQIIRGTDYANTYANDYRNLSALKRVSDDHGMVILLIHHLRKKPAMMCSVASPAPPPSAGRWTPA